jgi:hypothetical protein
MPLTIDGQANSITSSVGGVNIPATVDTLSVGPSGSYMIANSSGVGIGTASSSSYKLDLNGILNQRSYIRLTDNISGGLASDYWIGRGGAGSGAASLALYAPTSRALEFGVGNTSYMTVETNAVKLQQASTQILNNAGRPILNQSGSILQVVQTVKTDAYGQNGNAWTDIPGMSLTITPSSSSSKVLIECRIGIVSLNGTYSSAFRLYRGATLIGGGDVVNSSESVFFRSSQMVNSDHGASDGMTYLDSPATTSTTTYKIQMKVQNAAGCYINRDYTGNNNADVYGSRTISTLTALEVSV